ncbi:MAG: hypothetical protein Q8M01_14540 [Rubrivivax sp.]|nr:hypothetical protein [Rubrivivax sp.]
MFDKILIANRGDNARAAAVAAKPERVMREAHAGELAAVEALHV